MQMNPGQYLTFKLGHMSYGLPIATVREINRMSDIAAVPDAPHYVAGVMNLRGKVIPVVNLRKRLSMEDTQVTKETCIIVVETEIGQVGVIVDSVQAVTDLTQGQIDPSPVSSENIENFIGGIGKLTDHLLLLIDIQHCLSKEKMHGLKAA